MCGIIGGVGFHNIVPQMMKGLKRLEYRGYDSAGIAIINQKGELIRYRTVGKIENLVELLKKKPISGLTGIAHTRWATHGKPSEANAHPHIAGNQIAIVHNGIIENHQTLRDELLNIGCELTSETDSELIAHLIYRAMLTHNDFLRAVHETILRLKGAYAIAVMDRLQPKRLIAVRAGSPLVLAANKAGMFLASDVLALLSETQRFTYLEEGDIADIYIDHVEIYDRDFVRVKRPEHEHQVEDHATEKGHFKHYMLKEIFEQPQAIKKTLNDYKTLSELIKTIKGKHSQHMLTKVKRLQIVACGTSFYAGCVASYWFESLMHMPCHVEIASEYRYRHKVIEADTLFIAISQSGETADTLAALRQAKSDAYIGTLAICNVDSSSLVREADYILMTHAGPEIGVASTKAFTAQLAALLMLLCTFGYAKKQPESLLLSWLKQLHTLPTALSAVLHEHLEFKALAKSIVTKQHAFFLARGNLLPIAAEGALKLKEISYIHAEAYAAGELKHGPLALIDAEMPVIFLITHNALLEKIKSNLEEVHSRGGQIIVFTDKSTVLVPKKRMQVIKLPIKDTLITPILFVVPLQLLAYYVAILKGTDVDQPRNLAKSVTVE